ncbi:M20/M25/M40 family metallo-hydrolase [Ornithinimicrobium faecis]|uniref:M20/M25/M40 family metallo-hydrolase n=1 Tax=Ornithinimicrobium faecis TaxID=2934158 RepID=UPI0021199DAB|nr:M20/M25/M40 family metallo-hydrolase [Ornithinimicrobium sp. HY1745]
MADTDQRVLSAVEETYEDMVTFLTEMIQAPSVNPWFEDEEAHYREAAVQDVVEAKLRQLDATTIDRWEPSSEELAHRADGPGYYEGRDFTGRPNVVGTFEGSDPGAPAVMVQGHCDVVSVGSGWTRDPFGAERVDGVIYGRGTVDMKGGFACAVGAYEAIRRAGLRLRSNLHFASVADEEAGGMGTLALVDRGYVAPGGAIVPEATNLNIAPLCRGILWGRIIIRGRAGHIELQQKPWEDGGAVDAVDYGRRMLNAITDLNARWAETPEKNHQYLPIPCQVKVAQLDAGEYPTTYARECVITFNAQYLPQQKDANGLGSIVKKELEDFVASVFEGDAWVAQNPPEIEWFVDADCGETSDQEPVVQEPLKAAQAIGLESVLQGCMSHTDMGLMIDSGTPTINFGPGHMGVAHQADEHVTEEHLLAAMKVMALSLVALCGAEEEGA